MHPKEGKCIFHKNTPRTVLNWHGNDHHGVRLRRNENNSKTEEHKDEFFSEVERN